MPPRKRPTSSYLRGRYLELRTELDKLLPSRQDNARLRCLSGHARFGLGDFAAAAAEYRAAAEIDLRSGGGGSQPLFRMNEARAWDQAGKKSEAVEAYLAAARLFSAEEADDDLALALNRLAALKAKGAEVKEIRAKALYRAGKKDEAAKILAEIVAKGGADSGSHYTLGLILAEKGQGERRSSASARLSRSSPTIRSTPSAMPSGSSSSAGPRRRREPPFSAPSSSLPTTDGR